MRQAALDLAELGWRVFPVAADGRSPLVERGCYAASADARQVAAWWDRWPRANVALACGPDSGVLALDIDAKGPVDGPAALRELMAEFGPLPRTIRSLTPSGGAHLLFAWPAGPRPENRVGIKRYAQDGSRRVYHGLDVRGAGASVCLPPSAKAEGAYSWVRSPFAADLAPVPGWLLALMRSEPPPREVKPLRVTGSPERAARYVVAVVDGECGAVADTPAGTGRNQRLFVASARLGELVGAGLLDEGEAHSALERAAELCGLVKEDGARAVRLTIRSGLKRGIANPQAVAA